MRFVIINGLEATNLVASFSFSLTLIFPDQKEKKTQNSQKNNWQLTADIFPTG